MTSTHRIGEYTEEFENVKVTASGCIVGSKEGDGPLASSFDSIAQDAYFGKKTWEQAEGELQRQCAVLTLRKAGLKSEEIDKVYGGDLLDQCSATMQGMLDMGKSYCGIFGACSTMSQGLLLAAESVSAGFSTYSMAITSSHFCAAEKQFRFPLEYGSQRPQTSQWTVTGSGCFILEKSDGAKGVYITKGTLGKPMEMGITDANNMGAAMAPAAAHTIKAFLADTNTKPEDYDLIMTGDLGKEGSRLLKEILKEDGIDISSVHNDGGLMMFDIQRQDVHSGASGCGCSASIMAGKVMNDLKCGRLKKVLYGATGALMSATTALQKVPIIGICNIVELEAR